MALTTLRRKTFEHLVTTDSCLPIDVDVELDVDIDIDIDNLQNTSVIQSLRGLKHKDGEFEANLGHTETIVSFYN